MQGTNLLKLKGFFISLVLAVTQADLVLGHEPTCLGSSGASLRNLRSIALNDAAMTVIEVHQKLTLTTNSQSPLEEAYKMAPKLHFEDRGDTVWKELGQGDPGTMRDDTVREVSFYWYLQATTRRMVRDTNARACRTRLSGRLVHDPRQVPGCNMEAILIDFNRVDTDSHVHAAIYLNGSESRVISKGKGDNQEFAVDFEIDLYTEDITHCSLVQSGDYCHGVLKGETKLTYVNKQFIFQAFMLFSSVPTCIVILMLYHGVLPDSVSKRNPISTILIANVYGAILFIAVMFLIIPAHDHATYYLCGILWQPSLMSSLHSMFFYLYEPSLVLCPIFLVCGYLVYKARCVDTGTLQQLAIAAQCASVMYQIWIALFASVIFRTEGQGFSFIVTLTIVQIFLTCEFGSWVEEPESERKTRVD
ncbi:uncharacterized protein LOC135496976 [Lineus longissimus]|uniref:uncharacterized protein LOC135496976 n=1 Tax=Lineus longissimus TaxID=88925 RepID=UPI00315D7251